jgi:hypothetical protein
MFDAIGEKTLYIFGACNIITIPMVWALYPESNQRKHPTPFPSQPVSPSPSLHSNPWFIVLTAISGTLEEMDLLFAAPTPWVWDAERHFAQLKAENPDLVMAASGGNPVIDPEAGLKRSEEPVEERREVMK